MGKFINEAMAPDYQDLCVKKWGKILDIPGREIKDDYARIATAIVLENTQKELIGEDYSNGFGAGSGQQAGSSARALRIPSRWAISSRISCAVAANEGATFSERQRIAMAVDRSCPITFNWGKDSR